MLHYIWQKTEAIAWVSCTVYLIFFLMPSHSRTPFSSVYWNKSSANIESGNNRMVWIERELRYHLLPTPCHGGNIFHWIRLLRAPSNLTSGISRDGASIASLGNLFPVSPYSHREEFVVNIPSEPTVL